MVPANNELWEVALSFDVTDQLLIRFFVFVRFLGKNGSTMRVHQRFIDFKKAYDSVRREVIVQNSHSVCSTHEIS
jgi:hypothetical protein